SWPPESSILRTPRQLAVMLLPRRLPRLRLLRNLEQFFAAAVGAAKIRRSQRHQSGGGRCNYRQADRAGRARQKDALVDADFDIPEWAFHVDRRAQREQAHALAVRV